MLNNAFLSLSTVRFEMNTIPQLVSKVFFIENNESYIKILQFLKH